MIKKILPIILCLMLVFGISVSATNTQGDTPTENNQTTEEMPNRQERPQGGGRGNMGIPPNMPSGETPPELPEGMTPPEMPNGEMPPKLPEGMTPPEMPNGEMPPQMNGQANAENQQQSGQSSSGSNAENTTATEGNTNPNAIGRGEGEMGGFRGEMPPGMTEQEQKTEEKAENKILIFVKTYSTPIISVVLLAFAFLFVIFYKRKSY